MYKSLKLHVAHRYAALQSHARPTHQHAYHLARSASSPHNAALNDAGMRELVDWCQSNGIKFPNVTAADFGDGLRGLKATTDVRFGDVVCAVPNKQGILANDEEKCPFSDFIKPEFWDSAPLNVRMALKLLYEKRQGDKSKFAVYIKNLPQQIDLLVKWEKEQLEMLQYPYLLEAAQAVQQEWRSWHPKVQAALLGGDTLSWEEWYWALACARTRCYYGPWFATTTMDKVWLSLGALALAGAVTTQSVEAGIVAFAAGAAAVTSLVFWELDKAREVRRLILLPYLDLLNHSYLANKSVCFYDYGSSQHIVKSLRDYEAGEQVFMSYGQMSNDEALLYYGFMEQDNDEDVYVLTRLLEWLRQYAEVNETRVKALKTAKMLDAVEKAKVSATGTFSESTVDAVRYLLADESAAAGGPEAVKNAGDKELEKKVWEALAFVVRQELESLPTSVKADFESLQGEYIPRYKQISGVGEGSQRIATLFRIEKKKILFRCLERLSEPAAARSTPGLVSA